MGRTAYASRQDYATAVIARLGLVKLLAPKLVASESQWEERKDENGGGGRGCTELERQAAHGVNDTASWTLNQKGLFLIPHARCMCHPGEVPLSNHSLRDLGSGVGPSDTPCPFANERNH